MNIAIAGFGAEGRANYQYWNTPENAVTIVDEHELDADDVPTDASVITGHDAFGRLNGFDMVVRTAGLAPHKIVTDGKVWSATNEFFSQCPAPIIGVTGTKGKGTTSSLIASILRASGKTVHLVGNIGVPALAKLPEIQPDDVVVYELSSFQLWDLERSPHVAVVLMIEADHLDVHADFSEYIDAKSHITRYQTTIDRVVYFADNSHSTRIAEESVGQRLPYPRPQTAHVKGQFFYYDELQLCPIDVLQLPGAHNLQNACAAITAAWPWVQDPETIARGLGGFNGLPHRLKFVDNVRHVAYFNDSIATTPGSAIAALRSFDQPKVLILGGTDKGSDYTPLYDALAASDSVRAVVTMGANGAKLAQELALAAPQVKVTDMSGQAFDAVIEAAASAAQPGDVVILSPAAASFDMFKNYPDRGDQFISAVRTMKGEHRDSDR